MKRVIMIDRGQYSMKDIEQRPLAGAETAFIQLARAFGELGCEVLVRTNSDDLYSDDFIDWRPLSEGSLPQETDLFIANRNPSLLSLSIRTDKKILWIHNEAKYLLYWKNFRHILRQWPIVVFSGKYHRSTYPFFAPARKKPVIPYGLSDDFKLTIPKEVAPPPKVIFTSNPLRDLDWLVDRWVESIYPEVPNAELHIFSGPATYGKYGRKMADRMNAVLNYARSKSAYGIQIKDPIPKKELIRKLPDYRAMLYRGVKAETFCLAVAEAQGMGLPCVVQDIGSMKERIIDKKTGFVVKNSENFIQRAISVLKDDNLWIKLHKGAVMDSRKYNWTKAAQNFLDI